MDVTVVNPFITSTINTFTTMLGLAVTPGKPSLKTGGNHAYDVSGIIGLSGDAQGAIALSFPKITALKVVSKMLGMDIKVVGPEVSDGIGELANIVAGAAKVELSKFNLSISLPNVVIGKNHQIITPSGTPGILVPFACGVGEFAMEVTLKTD